MAERYAVATGNWSDPATWNGGTLPGNADDVYANGYTVTIDIDLTGSYSVLSIRTRQGTTAVAGGQFNVTSSRTIEIVAGGAGILAGTTRCLYLTHATPDEVIIRWGTGGSGIISTGSDTTGYRPGVANASSGTLTIIGDVKGGAADSAAGAENVNIGSITITGNVIGGAGRGHGVSNSSTGSISITGNVQGGGNYTYGVYNLYSGSISITGNVQGGNAEAYGIRNDGSGNVTVNGNVTGGNSNLAYGIRNDGSGNVTVNGNVTGGNYRTAYGINNSAGSVTIIGNATASNYAPAVYNESGVVDIQGSLYSSTSPTVAIVQSVNATAGKIIFDALIGDTTNHYFPGVLGRCFARNTSTYIKFYNASEALITFSDNTGINNPPAASDVRYGVSYTTGGGMTGTAHIPSPNSVAYGVPVDNTTGTAVLTPADVWNYANRTITGGTVDTVNDTVILRDTSSDAVIADAVWNALTANYGVTGSYGELIESGGGGLTAADVWNYANRTITGGTVTTVNDKTGYALSAAGVDAIWDELQTGHTTAGSFGAYLDAAVSSRSTFNSNSDTVILRDASSDAVIADAVWNALTVNYGILGSYGALIESGSVGGGGGVIVQPVVAEIQNVVTSGGTITAWMYARLTVAWLIQDVDLSNHDLRLILYTSAKPTTAVVEYGPGEITVTYNNGDSLVEVNGADTKTPAVGQYKYVLRDQTTDTVLLYGRCYVYAAPDAS